MAIASARDGGWRSIEGSSGPHIYGARVMYFVSGGQAVVASLTRRVPEPQAGGSGEPIKVPIRPRRIGGQIFNNWEQLEG